MRRGLLRIFGLAPFFLFPRDFSPKFDFSPPFGPRVTESGGFTYQPRVSFKLDNLATYPVRLCSPYNLSFIFVSSYPEAPYQRPRANPEIDIPAPSLPTQRHRPITATLTFFRTSQGYAQVSFAILSRDGTISQTNRLILDAPPPPCPFLFILIVNVDRRFSLPIHLDLLSGSRFRDRPWTFEIRILPRQHQQF